MSLSPTTMETVVTTQVGTHSQNGHVLPHTLSRLSMKGGGERVRTGMSK